MKKNMILISMDAVRPDHLSCYGYDKINTKGIDTIANDGVIFNNCIATSCLTPVSMASVLTGKYPNKTGFRDPFCKIKTELITEIMKDNGYKTSGYVGIDFLSKKQNFSKGFDFFNEPTEETRWNTLKYKKEKLELDTNWGNWWVDRMLDWIEKSVEPFFIWGHYFECHFLAEKRLLFEGKIPRDVLSDWAYYDAKIKYMDEMLFQKLVKKLKDLDIYDNTTIIITSDHGETLGTKQPSWETFYFDYPQHKTMSDNDLKVPLIIKDDKFKPHTIDDMVRGVDVVPTICDMLGFKGSDFDGKSLVPLICDDVSERGYAYSEEVFESRGKGALQSVRFPSYKVTRNITKNIYNMYNLEDDAEEKINILGLHMDEKEEDIFSISKRIMNDKFSLFSEKEKENISRIIRGKRI